MKTPDATHDPPRHGPRAADLTPAQLLQAYAGGPDGAPPHPDAVGDDDVLMTRRRRDPDQVAALTKIRAELTRSPNYRLLAAALTAKFGEPVEPMDLIARMALGRYRWARRQNGTLQRTDQNMSVPDRMALREISAELSRLSGEAVNHETVRRWIKDVWPGGVARGNGYPKPPRPVPIADIITAARRPGIPQAEFVAPPATVPAD